MSSLSEEYLEDGQEPWSVDELKSNLIYALSHLSFVRDEMFFAARKPDQECVDIDEDHVNFRKAIKDFLCDMAQHCPPSSIKTGEERLGLNDVLQSAANLLSYMPTKSGRVANGSILLEHLMGAGIYHDYLGAFAGKPYNAFDEVYERFKFVETAAEGGVSRKSEDTKNLREQFQSVWVDIEVMLGKEKYRFSPDDVSEGGRLCEIFECSDRVSRELGFNALNDAVPKYRTLLERYDNLYAPPSV